MHWVPGTELQGNVGILPERVLCWHNCSHCMCPAGQCYQTSKEAEGSEGRVRNIYSGDRYTEERWERASTTITQLVFRLCILLLNHIKVSTRIVWCPQFSYFGTPSQLTVIKTCHSRRVFLPHNDFMLQSIFGLSSLLLFCSHLPVDECLWDAFPPGA